MVLPPAPEAQAPAGDERRRVDRRRPQGIWNRHTWFGGRRRGGRRREDALFVDQHGAGLFFVACGIVTLNVLDAFFTVLFLSHGGREMNPLVDQLLRHGLWPFLAVKSVGIGLCILLLCLVKNFPMARLGLGFLFVAYAALLAWHVYLLEHVPLSLP